MVCVPVIFPLYIDQILITSVLKALVIFSFAILIVYILADNKNNE